MADNLGLLAGLAEGIKQGYGTYRDVKKEQREEAYKKALEDRQLEQFQAEMFSKGLQKGDEGFGYTPEKQAEIELGKQKTLSEIEGSRDDRALKYKIHEDDVRYKGESLDVERQKAGLLSKESEAKLKKLNAETLVLQNKLKTGEMSPLDQARLKKLEAETAKIKAESSGTGNIAMKYEKMPTEAKNKVGFLLSGLQGMTSYEDQFRGGNRQSYVTSQTPLVGKLVSDTPIDQERQRMEEAIGRMASGGAINAGEENRFKSMLPTAADTDENASRKLLSLRKEFETKLKVYGLSPTDLPQLGFVPKEYGYDTDHAKMDGRGLLNKKQGLLKDETAEAAKLPEVGSESKGYIFLGGDPSDSKSWKAK